MDDEGRWIDSNLILRELQAPQGDVARLADLAHHSTQHATTIPGGRRAQALLQGPQHLGVAAGAW